MSPDEGQISASLDGLGELHHFGIAVTDIEQAEIVYRSLGFVKETDVISDVGIDVKVQFLVNHGTRIELVQPLSESSPANVWLRDGSPIYHIAYLVDDTARSTLRMKDLRFRKIFGPFPAVAFDGHDVTFFMNRERLMIEIISQR